MSLEWLAEYAKNPTYKHRMENPDIAYTEHNRTCGDVMTVFMLLDEKKKNVRLFSFDGELSMIATAVGCMVGERVMGMSCSQILALKYSFVLDLLGEAVTPRRKNASALPLLALRNAIHVFLGDGKRDDFIDLE